MKKVHENDEQPQLEGRAITNGLFRLEFVEDEKMASGIAVHLWYRDENVLWRDLRHFDAGWLGNLATMSADARRLVQTWGGYADLTFFEFLGKTGS